MKFSKREDIEAPIATVFAAVANFGAWERMAQRRGIEVARTDSLEQPGPGMAWSVRAPIRGRVRDIALRLTGYTPQSAVQLSGDSGGMTAEVTVELIELSRARTRLQFGMEVKAHTLASRVLLQSARLAKATLDRRLERRLSDFAAEIESRQQGVKPGKRARREA